MQELKVGMLIATPADDNELGHQFWIGKVLDVVMHDNQNQMQSIRSSIHNLESRHQVSNEDNALIGTFEDDDKESTLYISYSSDSRS